MRLTLSSAAAPAATWAELLEAARRRGFAALELVEGDAHGIGPASSAAELARLRARAESHAVRIAAYRVASAADAARPAVARLAAALDAAVVAPADTVDIASLDALADLYRSSGAMLLLAHGTAPEVTAALGHALAQPGRESLGFAWDVRPEADDLGRAPAVLEAAGGRLRLVRLYGGGPEAATQTGQGVGALFGRLTLARYGGPLVLTPSTPRYRQAWGAWLGRVAGWGCGSKTADASLVQLAT